MTESQERRLASLQDEIGQRLRHVCVGWPPEVFGAMVERLAMITMKYDGVIALPDYDRRSSGRIIADLKAALERSEASHQEGKQLSNGNSGNGSRENGPNQETVAPHELDGKSRPKKELE